MISYCTRIGINVAYFRQFSPLFLTIFFIFIFFPFYFLQKYWSLGKAPTKYYFFSNPLFPSKKYFFLLNGQEKQKRKY